MALKKPEGKVTWRLLPFLAIEQIALVMMYGAKKHSPGGWKTGTYAEAREEYFDAAYRHLVIEWWEKGITFDPDTGLPHLAHAGCNVIFLIWYELKYKIGGAK